jgi:hypothetical protein
MRKFPLHRRAIGLNNAEDPVRLVYDPEKGVVELAAAVNVNIDSTGRFSRRRGYEQLLSLPGVHSLWAHGDQCFFVCGTAMYQLHPDWSHTGIRSGLTAFAYMSYAHLDGKTYYANGFENGVNHDGVSWAWVGEDYVGPETIHHIELRPPTGHLLEVMSGRMLIAQGDVMWFSMPFAPSHFRPSRDYVPFERRITMMRALPDGLWVSDETGIYWFSGHDPEQWVRARKANYPAIIGTSVLVDGAKLGDGSIIEMCVLFTTVRGICVGGPQGFFRNLTEKRLLYPTSPHGAAALVGDKYLVTMEP